MTRSEAEQITKFLSDAFPRLELEQIALYTNLLEREDDAELVSKAILKGIGEWKFAPSFGDLKEYIRERRKLAQPPRAQDPISNSRPMPTWVREYVCARFLFARFGREQDLRAFPQEHPDGVPPGLEIMPPNEWAEEAAQINLTDAWRALRSATTQEVQ